MNRSTRVRAAAAALVAAISASAVWTYLSYTDAFTPVARVEVSAPRSGLVLERGAKVHFLGIDVGRVETVEYDGSAARLTLAIRRDQISVIPANALVHIASNTVFGAKSVDFVMPEHPSESGLRPDARVAVSDVSVEANTLFQTLVDTLRKIDPVQLNATLTAVADGLRNHGADLGATLADANDYLARFNPALPDLHRDIKQATQVADVYGDAAPDLVTTLQQVPTLAEVVVRQRDDLNAVLLAAGGLADAGYATLGPAANDLIAAVQRLRAPLTTLGDYSPELPCLLQAIANANDKFGPYVGGLKPALFVSSSFLPGVPAYTYPESLPIVNASGGPNCRGLPNLPTKQGSGSWYRPPFLVTDNAYVPFQPNTELQFNAPNTLQFLFNGAFAERDDY